ncbi:anti-sigma factor [Maribacter polysaccharolyticus]|uniref:anti-sigma factor n=1 Tax=Maribacter polysaccharolyticus TaxID=3020831 RepID=UPI00237FA4D2|nr:anti-sigma factor [Maribacter polysaccharolyticus]MDE3740402.1 anti-sigma factor [Maribacter polysaccharolyticus]
MKKLNLTYALIMISVVLISSCSVNDDDGDEPRNSSISLNMDGLEDLGPDFLYEGWIIVDGAPVSTGTFSVNSNGDLSQTSFELDATTLASATKFVLSIEPNPDPSTDPADTKLFVGDFNGDSATLGTGTVASSFDMIEGKFIVATPTGTGAEEEKYSGIWFLDNSSGSAVNGLELPTLEPGWKYEGWVVMDGTPVTTGTFTSVTGSDDASPFSGTNPGPPFPGEDFLVNAPDGLMFPTDIRGKVAVISIEPYPDNSTAPFILKPLAGMIPADAMDVQEISSNVSSSFPTGTVTR